MFIIILIGLGLLLAAFSAWFHLTNPYASLSIVQQPFTTTVSDGQIEVHRQYRLRVLHGKIARFISYYGKSGFLILQNTYFGSRKTTSDQPDEIIKEIHRLRFDPAKPYLISGDQFSVLYARNLGVFYNSILNPFTTLDQKDWEHRQRIYLQSALFALDAFSQAKDLTTTLVPLGAKVVVLTQVHPESIPSDTVYGLFYALHALQDETRYESHSSYRLQTTSAVREVITSRKRDLQKLLDMYLEEVCDNKTGLPKPKLDLASARDGVVRDRSFYDAVVLWSTLDLAKKLDLSHTWETEKLRQHILRTYWNEDEGHFRDDLNDKPQDTDYSSDWLIALPTGFLNPENIQDRRRLKRIVAFIQQNNIDKPFPIKYQATNDRLNAPWAVRTFVPNYGGDAIWSYWGAQYIALLAQLARFTGNKQYQQKAKEYQQIYRQKMKECRGFPETFSANGQFLQNAVYKSIRRTGWVVQFEEAEWLIAENEKRAKRAGHSRK